MYTLLQLRRIRSDGTKVKDDGVPKNYHQTHLVILAHTTEVVPAKTRPKCRDCDGAGGWMQPALPDLGGGHFDDCPKQWVPCSRCRKKKG